MKRRHLLALPFAGLIPVPKADAVPEPSPMPDWRERIRRLDRKIARDMIEGDYVFDRNWRKIRAGHVVKIHYTEQEPTYHKVAEVFPDRPTENEPGRWIDVFCDGEDVPFGEQSCLRTGAMSYQCEIIGTARLTRE